MRAAAADCFTKVNHKLTKPAKSPYKISHPTKIYFGSLLRTVEAALPNSSSSYSLLFSSFMREKNIHIYHQNLLWLTVLYLLAGWKTISLYTYSLIISFSLANEAAAVQLRRKWITQQYNQQDALGREAAAAEVCRSFLAEILQDLLPSQCLCRASFS